MMPLLAWSWVFTLPGLLLTATGVPSSRSRAGYASLAGPPLLLLVALIGLISGGSYAVVFENWLPFLPDGAFRALADPLSALLLVILGFVATLVYVYSLGYMADDPARRRFFVYLDVFVATMALLVLAGNLAVLLIGWTGVGISSFLLISFWRDRPGTLGAGLQALAANAVGDGALLLAASIVPTGCGSLITLGASQCTAGYGGAELLALLIFVAAAAKSAQGPLYFWLPNAMAGPTPISALIHAATMVAAGVYLLVRTHTLLDAAPQVSLWGRGHRHSRYGRPRGARRAARSRPLLPVQPLGLSYRRAGADWHTIDHGRLIQQGRHHRRRSQVGAHSRLAAAWRGDSDWRLHRPPLCDRVHGAG